MIEAPIVEVVGSEPHAGGDSSLRVLHVLVNEGGQTMIQHLEDVTENEKGEM